MQLKSTEIQDQTAVEQAAAGLHLKVKPSRRSKKLVNYGYWWWAFPGVGVIVTLHYLVIGIGGAFSFTDYTGIGTFNWIGLDNYNMIWEDPEIASSLYNTFFLGIGSLVLSNVAGLTLALALNRILKSRYLVRTLLFLPVILSTIASAYIFKYIFALDGPVNGILSMLGLQNFQPLWLGDPVLAMWVILIVVVWHQVPIAMVIFLAGLAGVPQELEEAAALDGATTWQRFRKITLPLIQPALAISTTLGLIHGMKSFDQIMAMTGGGPYGSTESLASVIYHKTFEFMQFGYGSAIAMIFSVLILILAVIQNYLTRDRGGVTK